ncbi:hypothetical protein STRTUCAR8_08546 [Streptomyces turgidiscabies Car8]|uniref:HK97 gp10 family phage protein n=1 Tax=Streptomyces turgidiscabies (strain Car8) TaxID=698760 RepID=L7F7W7_STRT8|nr:hypothetical protein [Streptomyces turgidiscabies]ELP67688.1 hypothetical protein STRTUCAR8_08546 [Streptomyces turgidiscabies Car8]
MGELRPGVFTRLFAEIQHAGQMKAHRVITQLALAVERQAKINTSVGAHRRGTPTPARPGAGPAVVSGTLRRSITHSPVIYVGGGWETKVGTAVGFTPPHGRTPANKYGYYLEKEGLKNGATYPFLKPAFDFGARVVAPQLYQAVFRPGWPRI